MVLEEVRLGKEMQLLAVVEKAARRHNVALHSEEVER